ncbi:MAG: amidohydrolase [Verrucomicrobiota bacterium]|nr:amidohydrolase [Verrucomicrobiota bacterium]
MNSNITQSLGETSNILKKLALDIHANPELGLQEYKAVEKQIKLLKEWGFDVEIPFSRLETAYKAVSGTEGPCFCFMSEYDALPELGHACGHNLIAMTALGAGKALAETLKKEKIPGKVVIMGTPGEEGAGGKVHIVERGGLSGIDAVIMAHPGFRTATWKGCLAVKRFNISFKGKAAHASGAPEKGKNALDAIMLLFHGVNAWREHTPETSRIHGIVTNGGAVPNIVPETASCSFYIRAQDEGTMEILEKRLKKIVEGAALMTETESLQEEKERGYKSGAPNQHLNNEYFRITEALGMSPVIPESCSRASTDFGDVSQVLPATHVYFGILQDHDRNAPLHSIEFAKAAKSEFGLSQALKTANSLAQVGYKFFTDDAFRKQVTGC